MCIMADSQFTTILYLSNNNVMKLTDTITVLKGIGPKTEQQYKKLQIDTIANLLTHYPREYKKFTKPIPYHEINVGEIQALVGIVPASFTIRRFGYKSIVEGRIHDGNGQHIQVVWYNMPYMKTALKKDDVYVFLGKVVLKKQGLVLEQPALYHYEEYEKLRKKLLPVYALTAGISQNAIRKQIETLLAKLSTDELQLNSCLTNVFEKEHNLMPYKKAINQIHFPENEETFQSARERIVFEEFYQFMLQIKELKQHNAQIPNQYICSNKQMVEAFIKTLPYTLTNGQLEAFDDIYKDMASHHIMNRLIQGDVGSGKTIVCFLAMLLSHFQGYQSVMMAPTELLAKQHYENFMALTKQAGICVQADLLVGGMSMREKTTLKEKLQGNEISVLFGTHALFEESTVFHNLALVITDEQHRFGVKQREQLQEKSKYPHRIILSATPIPRSLARVLYAELDVSIIKDKPSKRKTIETCVIKPAARTSMYQFIKKQVDAGHQAYIVCPMVEANEEMDGENVVDYAKQLNRFFKNEHSIACIHGQMNAKEKNRIMQEFAQNKISILVATTVIEVGIDVANATVMVVEDAQRFGLATLHQLRGRVGRSNLPSYCILVQTNKSTINDRLDVLCKFDDGFYIAQEDLKLRGPGDLMGVRQSGEISFKLANIYQDHAILLKASKAIEHK